MFYLSDTIFLCSFLQTMSGVLLSINGSRWKDERYGSERRADGLEKAEDAVKNTDGGEGEAREVMIPS